MSLKNSGTPAGIDPRDRPTSSADPEDKQQVTAVLRTHKQ